MTDEKYTLATSAPGAGDDDSSDRHSSAMPSDEVNKDSPKNGTRESVQDELQSLRTDVKALQASMMLQRNNSGEVKNEEKETPALPAAALSRSNVHPQSMNKPQSSVEPASKCDLTENKKHVRFTPLFESKKTAQEELKLAIEIDKATDDVASPFETSFSAIDMRQLALVAHNHMKPAMKDFIKTYGEVLQKFRITGTETTMSMCKTLWGRDNSHIEYGLTCSSGPLGGDAQIASLMCSEDLGALIFFIDPLSAHPHQADIDSLNRLANCGNILVCSNPTSAMTIMHVLKIALMKGDRGMIPSFFGTLQSPAVEDYKHQQMLALRAAVASTNTCGERPTLGLDASMRLPKGSNMFTHKEASENTNQELPTVGAGTETSRFSNRQASVAHQKTHQEISTLGLDRSMRQASIGYLKTHQEFSTLGLDRSLVSTQKPYINLLEEKYDENEDNMDDINYVSSGLPVASVNTRQELSTLGLDTSTHFFSNRYANVMEGNKRDAKDMDNTQDSTPVEGDSALVDLSTVDMRASNRLSGINVPRKNGVRRGLAKQLKKSVRRLNSKNRK